MLPSHRGGLVLDLLLLLLFCVGLVAVVVVMVVGWWLWWWFGFFWFVCEFGYNCGLQLKWWFRSCGCGHCGFDGYGCVATFTIAIATERWEKGEY